MSWRARAGDRGTLSRRFRCRHHPGVLTFADGLALVEMRGNAMAREFGPGYAMGAILGKTERQIDEIIALAKIRETVFVAVVNAFDQVVVSGTEKAVARVLELARHRGARDARFMQVDVPSHTPFMLRVRDELASASVAFEWHRATVPVAANVDGRALFEAEEVASDVIESVARPVRWLEATQMLHERGVNCFVETFLSDTLTRLIETAFPQARALSLARTACKAAASVARRYC